MHTAPLLPEHKHDSHARLVEYLFVSANRLHLGNEGQLLATLEIGDDLVELQKQVRIVFRLAPDMCQSMLGISQAMLFNQPTRGFVLEDDQEEEDARKHLERKGNTPFGRVGGALDLLADAVVDKIAQHDARDVEQLHAGDGMSVTGTAHLTVTTHHPIQRPRISLFAFSPMYVGTTALMRPTPKPPMNRPT